jgi:hypothetical protein
MTQVAGARGRLETPETFLDADGAAARILEAVQADELYAITHPSWLPLVRDRHQGLEAAFARAAARWPG